MIYRGRIRIGVYNSIGGWKAVLYDNNGPIQTGIGAYETEEEAQREATEWAHSEGFKADFE
jgi:L-alanine-DL-glutamate epimerase-like enolase superfamily enzyme